MRPTLNPMLPTNLLQACQAHPERYRDLLGGKLQEGTRDVSARRLLSRTSTLAEAYQDRGIRVGGGEGEFDRGGEGEQGLHAGTVTAPRLIWTWSHRQNPPVTELKAAGGGAATVKEQW